MTKVCPKCGEEKEIKEYGVSLSKKSGLKSRCKKCLSIDKKLANSRNGENIKIYKRAYYKKKKQEKDKLNPTKPKVIACPEFKVCKKCNKDKSIGEFAKCSEYRHGVLNNCKECMSEYIKAYKKQNKEKVKGYKMSDNEREYNISYRKLYISKLKNGYVRGIAKGRFGDDAIIGDVLEIIRNSILIKRIKKAISDSSDSKICSKCKQLKNKDMFLMQKNGTYRSCCNLCKNEYKRNHK